MTQNTKNLPIRTFIAIESNTELKNLVIENIEKLKRMGFKSNWTKKENIHLTMLFLGNLSVQKIAEIAYKLGERISGFPTFVYSVDKLGYFKFKESPKVIWVGVSGKQTLHGLYKEVKSSVLKCGLDVKNEEFVPHITVGRVKKHPEHWEKLIGSMQFEPIKVPVNSIGIYSSQLTKTGPIYTKMYTIDFEGGVIING